MNKEKSNLNYKELNLNGKPVFIFINHRIAILCWNKIKESNKCDIVTFDSHRDFRNGTILDFDNLKEEVFASKYNKYSHPHFTKCEEFILWDMSNQEQNKKIMEKVNKYFTILNDNFIDVAFMKGIIKNVFWYYRKTENAINEARCEDVQDKDHNYFSSEIKKFIFPRDKFILDIDLDFFVKNPGVNECSLFPIKQIKKDIDIITKLSNNKNCMGITIAIEPGCCGGEENCIILLKELSNKLGINLNKEIENL